MLCSLFPQFGIFCNYRGNTIYWSIRYPSEVGNACSLWYKAKVIFCWNPLENSRTMTSIKYEAPASLSSAHFVNQTQPNIVSSLICNIKHAFLMAINNYNPPRRLCEVHMKETCWWVAKGIATLTKMILIKSLEMWTFLSRQKSISARLYQTCHKVLQKISGSKFKVKTELPVLWRLKFKGITIKASLSGHCLEVALSYKGIPSFNRFEHHKEISKLIDIPSTSRGIQTRIVSIINFHGPHCSVELPNPTDEHILRLVSDTFASYHSAGLDMLTGGAEVEYTFPCYSATASIFNVQHC